MKKGWLTILMISAMASCRGPTGTVPTDHETEAEAIYVDMDIRDYSRIIEKNHYTPRLTSTVEWYTSNKVTTTGQYRILRQP